jgi:choline-sulfatase
MPTAPAARPPNLLLLITDQQRAPMHWPAAPQWLDALTPTDAELRRTGVSFEQAFIATCMCSPSRASFLTGTFPSRHGVRLTLTSGDLWPDPATLPDVLRTAGRLLADGGVPRARLLRLFARSTLRLGPKSGREPELPAAVPTIARMLRASGYEVVLKGKWHLTKPVAGHEFGPPDSKRLERDYGFAGWEPPDAGGDAKARHFGGGNAGHSGEGWDEDYTRQAERWLAQDELPEPFCLIASLVNPHDVLGYPGSYEAGGYDAAEFRDLGVELPSTVAENLREKPSVQALAQLGQAAYLGALRDRRARLDYVNFYAHLHRVVDRQLARIVAALGERSDPRALRARTVVVRFSDHGELGLAHGGLRQKMFNAYEETMRIPLIVSNPLLFPGGATSRAPVSLVDVVPTMLALAGADSGGAILDGVDLTPVLAQHANRAARISTGSVSRSPRSPMPGCAPLRCARTFSSPTTTTKRVPLSRRLPDSRTESAACVTGATSTPSTSTQPVAQPPSTSSTTWPPIRSSRATWSTSDRGPAARRPRSASAAGCTSASPPCSKRPAR